MTSGGVGPDNFIELICRIYIFLLSVYHLFTGAISIFTPDFAFRFYKKTYGTDPVEKKMLTLVMKPWGALAFFIGFVGMYTALDIQIFQNFSKS